MIAQKVEEFGQRRLSSNVQSADDAGSLKDGAVGVCAHVDGASLALGDIDNDHTAGGASAYFFQKPGQGRGVAGAEGLEDHGPEAFG